MRRALRPTLAAVQHGPSLRNSRRFIRSNCIHSSLAARAVLQDRLGARRRAPRALLRPLLRADCMRLARVSAYPPSPGLPIAIVVDVHDVREASMRLVACLAMCLILILANAAQTGAQAPSDSQGYCVNTSADFYPYTGELCKSGYQLGSGNCRRTDGRMVAVPREQCASMHGIVEVPFEGGRPIQPIQPYQAPKSAK
jgi:hypothetical protein